MKFHKARRGLLLLPALLALAGCNLVVLNPAGDIAKQQGQLIVVSTLLMLLIIVPVILLTLIFAWRYRKSNTAAKYEPNWDHSTRLELIIWGAPLLIIIVLGLITWISTHLLDPYRPLERISANQKIAEGVKPLEVDVVALDWKWLFIYPAQGIASVNELVTPVNVPITFKITSSTVMNAFFIPSLAGQIYAMPSMQTELHAVMNKPGVYDGLSSNYSGAGYSYMQFKYHAVSQEEFNGYVQKAKAGGDKLDRAAYLALEKPSEREPVHYYGAVEPKLFSAVVNRCVEPGTVCMDKMMATDADRVRAVVSGEVPKHEGAGEPESHTGHPGNEGTNPEHKMPGMPAEHHSH